MIIGEIKRYLRDDGILKVSRSLKENHYRIYQVREALTRRLEREPTTGEMAEEMGISIEELVMTMESGAEVESLHKTIYQGEGTEISLMDKLPEKENRQEKVLDRIFLEEILGTLEAKERRLIYMRYFQNMTQMEIAHELGVSQVQVSRMEKKLSTCLLKRISSRLLKRATASTEMLLFSHGSFLWAADLVRLLLFYEKVHFCIWKVLQEGSYRSHRLR